MSVTRLPSYPTRSLLLDAVAAARESIAAADQALAVLAEGVGCGAVSEEDGVAMLQRILGVSSW